MKDTLLAISIVATVVFGITAWSLSVKLRAQRAANQVLVRKLEVLNRPGGAGQICFQPGIVWMCATGNKLVAVVGSATK